MSFDDFVAGFGEQQEKQKAKVTPNEISETFSLGQELINKDYLPTISKIKLLKLYLTAFKELNLYKLNWRFNFGSSKSWAGLCSEDENRIEDSKIGKNIYVSIQFVKHDHNWKQNMTDTIYHEISHALLMVIFSGKESELHKIDDLNKASKGHGILWKAVCKSLCGHECRIAYENMDLKESFKDYKYNCTFCGHEGFGDYLNFTDTCSECDKSIITQSNTE